MNKQEAIKKIKNIDTLNINDRITNQKVDMVIKNQALDIISQIDEPQKPKVSRVAVEFYEKYKDETLTLGEWFGDFYSEEAIEDFPRMEELTEWLYDNDNETNGRRELALATLVALGIDAVEIEQDKLYTVEIPNPNNEYSMNVLIRLPSSGKISLVALHKPNTSYLKNKEYQLTESEIKQDFEFLWQFAKEVETDE